MLGHPRKPFQITLHAKAFSWESYSNLLGQPCSSCQDPVPQMMWVRNAQETAWCLCGKDSSERSPAKRNKSSGANGIGLVGYHFHQSVLTCHLWHKRWRGCGMQLLTQWYNGLQHCSFTQCSFPKNTPTAFDHCIPVYTQNQHLFSSKFGSSFDEALLYNCDFLNICCLFSDTLTQLFSSNKLMHGKYRLQEGQHSLYIRKVCSVSIEKMHFSLHLYVCVCVLCHKS